MTNKEDASDPHQQEQEQKHRHHHDGDDNEHRVKRSLVDFGGPNTAPVSRYPLILGRRNLAHKRPANEATSNTRDTRATVSATATGYMFAKDHITRCFATSFGNQNATPRAPRCRRRRWVGHKSRRCGGHFFSFASFLHGLVGYVTQKLKCNAHTSSNDT